MCGLFGYVGAVRSKPQLTAQLAAAGRRGPHAHGWLADGRLTRQLGPMKPGDVPRARSLLGHARLATAGSPRDPTGIQPLTAGPVAVVHNGTIPGWRPSPACPSDSWLILRVYETWRGILPPGDALTATMHELGDPPHAALVLDGDVLAASRRLLPLWWSSCWWFAAASSVDFNGATQLPDGTVTSWAGDTLTASPAT